MFWACCGSLGVDLVCPLPAESYSSSLSHYCLQCDGGGGKAGGRVKETKKREKKVEEEREKNTKGGG